MNISIFFKLKHSLIKQYVIFILILLVCISLRVSQLWSICFPLWPTKRLTLNTHKLYNSTQPIVCFLLFRDVGLRISFTVIIIRQYIEDLRRLIGEYNIEKKLSQLLYRIIICTEKKMANGGKGLERECWKR